MTATSFYSFPLISVANTVPYTRGASLILTGLSFIEPMEHNPHPPWRKGRALDQNDWHESVPRNLMNVHGFPPTLVSSPHIIQNPFQVLQEEALEQLL